MDNSNEFLKMAENNIESAKILYVSNKYRNALSIAYYSMYYCARALVAKKGVQPSTHAGLISDFYKLYVKTNIFNPEIAKYLGRGETDRNTADYNAFIETSERKASNTIEHAKKFFNETNRVFNELFK